MVSLKWWMLAAIKSPAPQIPEGRLRKVGRVDVDYGFDCIGD